MYNAFQLIDFLDAYFTNGGRGCAGGDTRGERDSPSGPQRERAAAPPHRTETEGMITLLIKIAQRPGREASRRKSKEGQGRDPLPFRALISVLNSYDFGVVWNDFGGS